MNVEITKEELDAEGVTPDDAHEMFMVVATAFYATFNELPGTIYLPRDFYDALELKTRLKTLDLPPNAELTFKHTRGQFKVKQMPGSSAIITTPRFL